MKIRMAKEDGDTRIINGIVTAIDYNYNTVTVEANHQRYHVTVAPDTLSEYAFRRGTLIDADLEELIHPNYKGKQVFFHTEEK